MSWTRGGCFRSHARAVLFLCALFFSFRAAASERSAFESSVVAEALEAYDLQAEDEPEGKRIEAIYIHRLEVFDERDPVPDFLNALHGTTRERVVRRELLFCEGDAWRTTLVEETERSLRGRRQFSLANIVAAKGSTPDAIRVVVITKDVWSLRLNSNFAVGGGGLEYLLLNPAEENLFGTMTSFGLLYQYEPYRQLFGARLIQPRLFGTRFYVAAQVAPIIRNEGFVPEGSTGTFIFERPQFSRQAVWSFGTRASWRSEVVRRTVQTQLTDYVFVHDDSSTEKIPWQYSSERFAAEYYGVFSRGFLHKQDLLFGFEIDSRRYAPYGVPVDASEEAKAGFQRDVLPVSDRRYSPFVQLRFYETRYHRTLSMELLGLQEDFRLGYDMIVRAFAGARPVGSTRDLFGTYFGASYSFALGDGFARMLAYHRSVLANDAKNEGVAVASTRATTPLLGPGRVHLAAEVGTLYLNHLNLTPFSVGGDGSLRGYRTGEFVGQSYASMNAEYRTRGVDVLSAQAGFAFFYDVAGAAPRLEELVLHQGLGVGLRILFPQAERAVLRLDVAVPLDRDDGRAPLAFFATFGQAFGMPGLVTPSVTSALSSF